jgi:glycosyltransferase involved in cell wall biosynthesis
MNLSIVIPVYNEKDNLSELLRQIQETLSEIKLQSCLIIFVDDGSTDGSKEVLADLSEKHKSVMTIRLRRNFGKSVALQCGFRHAHSEVVITMDADLQDDPKEIPRLLDELRKGSDLACGWRKKRLDPWHKTLPSKLYNAVTARVSGVSIHDFNCGFKAYRKEVLQELDIYGEMHRYIPVLAGWRGFKISEVDVEHHPRLHGTSKYGAERFLAGVLDLLTTYYVTRFSKKPSRLFGASGLICFAAGLVIDFHLLWIKLTGGVIGDRQPYMMLGILLTIMGMQLIFIGLMSELLVYFYQRFKKEYSIEYIK